MKPIRVLKAPVVCVSPPAQKPSPRRVLTMGSRLNPSLSWPSNFSEDLTAKSNRDFGFQRLWGSGVQGLRGA